MKCNSNFCPFFLGNSQHPWLLGSCRDEIIPPWHGMNQPAEAGKTTPAKRQPFLLLKATQLHLKTNMEPKNWCLEDDVPFQSGTYFQVPCLLLGGSTANQLRYIPYAHTYIYTWIPRLPKKTPGEIPPFGFFRPRNFRVCWKSPSPEV